MMNLIQCTRNKPKKSFKKQPGFKYDVDQLTETSQRELRSVAESLKNYGRRKLNDKYKRNFQKFLNDSWCLENSQVKY